MREIALQHVEREHACVQTTFVSKNEFRFRIDEFPNEPRRTDTIDLRPRPSEPDLCRENLAARAWVAFSIRAEFPQVSARSSRDLSALGLSKKSVCSDLAKLFSNAIKFPVRIPTCAWSLAMRGRNISRSDAYSFARAALNNSTSLSLTNLRFLSRERGWRRLQSRGYAESTTEMSHTWEDHREEYKLKFESGWHRIF